MAKLSQAQKIIRALQRTKKTWYKDSKDFYKRWTRLRNLLFKTREYKLFMTEVRARAQGRCNRCPARGREIHHKIRVYDDPSLALDPSNGELLCIKCHKKEHRTLTPK